MLVFVSNDYKTEMQLVLAGRLIDEGIKVFFVVFNDYWERRVKDAQYDYQRIRFSQAVEAGKGTHAPAPPFSLDDLVVQDHALKGRSAGFDYISGVYAIYRTLFTQLVERLDAEEKLYILGESSRGHETLLLRMCNTGIINGRHIVSCTTRYPSNRFVLFTDEYQRDFITPSTEAEMPSAEEAVQESEPSYFATTLNYLEGKNRLSVYVRKAFKIWNSDIYDTDDPHFSRGKVHFIKSRVRFQTYRVLYKSLVKKVEEPDLEARYGFFALQRYPESTVDVLGRHLTDQLGLIETIAHSLTPGMKLYVKDHRTAIGERAPSFYRALARIRNVVLVTETFPAAKLIERAECVFSISGTVTLEAYFKDVPSAIFSNIYLNKLKNVASITPSDFRGGFHSVLEQIRSKEGTPREQYYEYINSISYPGKIGDHLTEPDTIAPANVAHVVSALKALTGIR